MSVRKGMRIDIFLPLARVALKATELVFSKWSLIEFVISAAWVTSSFLGTRNRSYDAFNACFFSRALPSLRPRSLSVREARRDPDAQGPVAYVRQADAEGSPGTPKISMDRLIYMKPLIPLTNSAFNRVQLPVPRGGQRLPFLLRVWRHLLYLKTR